MKAFAWVEPADLRGAVAAGAQPGALYKAGGVDVQDRLKEHIDEPRQLVNLRRLKELDFLREENGGLRIGPLVTLARLAVDPAVRKTAPALAQAAEGAATPQVRNLATLGGNLAQRPRCWYFRREEFRCKRKGGEECFAIDGQNEMHAVFDNQTCAIVHPSATATALCAIGARLRLRGPKGERTIAIEDFFVRPEKDVTRETVLGTGELIVEIQVDPAPRSAYVKLMEKQSFDWPLAEAAVSLADRGARVWMGAAAPVPWRASAAEKMLATRTLDAALAEAAASAAVEGATPLRHNAYKVPLLAVAVRRALLAAGGLT
jgi:xanthine dehydrogenase YagS FAD-binding subunit